MSTRVLPAARAPMERRLPAAARPPAANVAAISWRRSRFGMLVILSPAGPGPADSGSSPAVPQESFAPAVEAAPGRRGPRPAERRALTARAERVLPRQPVPTRERAWTRLAPASVSGKAADDG